MGYEHKRSKNLLKVKPEDSEEAMILDIKEGVVIGVVQEKQFLLNGKIKFLMLLSKGLTKKV